MGIDIDTVNGYFAAHVENLQKLSKQARQVLQR
jgi:hypothetical protein